jgi:hypothetical protein
VNSVFLHDNDFHDTLMKHWRAQITVGTAVVIPRDIFAEAAKDYFTIPKRRGHEISVIHNILVADDEIEYVVLSETEVEPDLLADGKQELIGLLQSGKASIDEIQGRLDSLKPMIAQRHDEVALQSTSNIRQ